MYALFAAPPDRDLEWQEDGVAGIIAVSGASVSAGDEVGEYSESAGQRVGELACGANANAREQALLRTLHQTIAKITEDFSGRWHFNTCIAAIMILVNEFPGRRKRRSMQVKFRLRKPTVARCCGRWC